MMNNRTPVIASFIAAVAVCAVGCGNSDSAHPSATSAAPTNTATVAAPTEVSHYGPLEIRISAVDEVPLAPNNTDGTDPATPGTVFTFIVKNDGNAAVSAPDGWSAPALNYGADGTPAETAMPYSGESDDSIGKELNGNSIAPGATQTVREGFAVRKSQLTTATVTIGSATWQGDFANFKSHQ